MTQGTIYNYVSSEDSILYLVGDRIVAEYNEQARRALDTSHDPVERIAPRCAQSRRFLPRSTLHYCACLVDFEKEGDDLPHSRRKVVQTMAEQVTDHCDLAHPVATDGNRRLFLALTKISSME